MRAARLHGPGDVRIDEIPGPRSPGPHEALVAPEWCGLCGTDLKEYQGRGHAIPHEPHPLTGAYMPMILGHEFSARVVAVGSGVTAARPGDRVAIMPLLHCGSCMACQRGDHVLCASKAWTGLSTQWGGLGDLALVEDYQLTQLNDMTAEQGALVEPAAVAMNAIDRGGMHVGDTVLIIGCGPIGALAILAAKASGAASVLVSEPDRRRSELARALGATVLEGSPAEQLQLSRDASRGYGVDLAVDCAGKPGTLASAVQAVRAGGTVSVPAVHPGSVEIDARLVTRNAVTVRGSMGYTRAVWDATVALIAAGRFEVGRVVTSRIARADVGPKGLEALTDPGSGALKILVNVQS